MGLEACIGTQSPPGLRPLLHCDSIFRGLSRLEETVMPTALRTPRFLQLASGRLLRPGGRSAGGTEGHGGGGVAQVLLRRARLAAVRRHHRARRVLPHAHRGGHLRGPRAGDRRRAARAHRLARGPERAGRPGRRQLRQGRAAVRGAAPAPLRGGRHLGRLPAPGHRQFAAPAPGAGDGRRRPGLLGPAGAARVGARRAARRPGGGVLPGIEHRQLQPRRRAAPAARGARTRPWWRTADRRRPRQAGGGCSKPPTTTTWASRRPST